MSRVPEEKASLLGSVFGFYALQEIEAGIQEKRARGHREYLAEERFEQEFKEYANRYYEDMAKWLHDYFAIAALSEARHLLTRTDVDQKAYITVHGNRLTDEFSRSYTDTTGSYANPIQFLPILHGVFSDSWYWHEGYGGRSWQMIVEAVQSYYELPPTVFIDHVVDLSHNSGLAFDKDVLLYWGALGGQYLDLLDIKSKGSIFDVFDTRHNEYLYRIQYVLRGGDSWDYAVYGIPSQLKRMLTRAHVLGYICIPYERILDLVVNPDFIFPHISWGEAEVAIRLRESCSYCGNSTCVCDTLEEVDVAAQTSALAWLHIS